MRGGKKVGFACAAILAQLLLGCGTLEPDEEPEPKLVTHKRQPKFKPEDFHFVEYQDPHTDGRGAMWGTCLRVPMHDAHGNTWDCGLGITMPRKLTKEKWPRIAEEAARYTARALNASRKRLREFEHADARTCRAFQQIVAARLSQSRNGWPGTKIVHCRNYLGDGLPTFYFKRNGLLIGDYREWSKRPK